MESLQYKRNVGPGTKVPSSLDSGEIAIDLVDATLYYGKADGTIGRGGGLYEINTVDTDTISVSGDGRLTPLKFELKLSSQPDNVLEVRNGGIGVWADPPADVSNLFVDSAAGNDANPGSRALPKKTITAALDVVLDSPNQGGYTINLKAGSTFTLNKTYDLVNKQLQILAYGDPDYGDASFGICPGYYPYAAANYRRPVVNITWSEFVGSGVAICNYIWARTIIAEAIDFNVNLNATGLPINPNGTTPIRGSQKLTYRGCFFRRPSRFVFIQSGGNLASTLLHITNYDQAATTPGFYTDSIISWTHLSEGGASIPACGQWKAYVEMIGNIRTLVRYNSVSSGTEWDVPSRTLFGCTVSWNVFI